MARKRFANLDDVSHTSSFKELQAWRKERKGKVKDRSFFVGQAANKEIDYLNANRTDTTVTWIGHSTFLLQIGGLNILTDPVWANSMAFERRLSPPGLEIDEIPPINVVLISHSHYDHLHLTSLRKLARYHKFKVLVPEGLRSWMQWRGFRDAVELPWWGSVQVGEVIFDFVPAQHWTRRTLFNTNATHWGGWVLRSKAQAAASDSNDAKSRTIYFAGDSGYFRGFGLIGEKYDIGTALMPIGAYEPEWFMGKQHVTPEEAIQAYIDSGAERFIPMHYGSFPLADDTTKEALDRLRAEWSRRELPEHHLKVLLHGETLRVQG
ncbi:MBL fold metallo-hydrolase [Paenibacillus albiflavus]|uniref:MBL fold metallo-hydrolase n=1 Tax=Paenibacillus albiflavus TaxID=2545760 RepID=A0A4R4EHZ8_9BACL|nr:MBL fold metallo-hydrolase [Paenibacillus albiflavus]TCZ77805.1 MBL fold metallo-hydrolase [Paenibacillus albiflavus]